VTEVERKLIPYVILAKAGIRNGRKVIPGACRLFHNYLFVITFQVTRSVQAKRDTACAL